MLDPSPKLRQNGRSSRAGPLIPRALLGPFMPFPMKENGEEEIS